MEEKSALGSSDLLEDVPLPQPGERTLPDSVPYQGIWYFVQAMPGRSPSEPKIVILRISLLGTISQGTDDLRPG